MKGVPVNECTCYECQRTSLNDDFDPVSKVPRYIPRIGELIMVRDREGCKWYGAYHFNGFRIFENKEEGKMEYAWAAGHGYWKEWRHLTGHEQLCWRHIMGAKDVSGKD